MENTEFLWTDGTNKDFCEFYRITEDFYSSLVGGENKRTSFIPYNASADIPMCSSHMSAADPSAAQA